MRIVIAPDKFKGSLDAAEVCAHLAAGIRAVLPAAEICTAPMADGGEGTVDAAIAAGFARRTRQVTGPLGAPVHASFALRDDQAVIELAAASGLLLIDEPDRDALAADTRGTGELIAAALDEGARRIVLAVGGSASTDGGTGILKALGAKFLDAAGRVLAPGGGALHTLDRIDLAGFDPRIFKTDIVLASDVDHLLTGDFGAARVFAPQKGASESQVELLEAGLQRLAEVVRGLLPGVPDHAISPGAGAAGGVGFGALAMLGARRRAGAEIVAEVIDLAGLVQGAAHRADLVITGEGSFDAQSLGGKTPMGVLGVARELGVPTVLVCGRALGGAEVWRDAGFSACHAVSELAPDAATSMRDAGVYLERIGSEIARTLV
ncbi:glycerate kinase [Leucobacter exalbidus]|uniref:Glycerate kinase n=1 Tax=Leucobacter exalbidus TaxID=662960 RepID=A0A940PMS0_9MICO|nr:glycerate kinase [Leucobacter exalbidus]MBP1326018.1 glycerate kinase [Leucobacter exalbidus]